jgi:hypothetical protein
MIDSMRALRPLCQASAGRDLLGDKRLQDEGEGLSCDVALQDAQGVFAGVTLLGGASSRELASARVVNHSVVGDGPEGVVGIALSAAVEAVPLALAAAGLDGAHAAERGERGVAVESAGVATGGDE